MKTNVQQTFFSFCSLVTADVVLYIFKRFKNTISSLTISVFGRGLLNLLFLNVTFKFCDMPILIPILRESGNGRRLTTLLYSDADVSKYFGLVVESRLHFNCSGVTKELSA